MGTFFLLAAEASAVHSELTEGAEGGFGLNLDILETNLINLAILIGILFYFGRKVLINILAERSLNIETEIREAEERAREAASALAAAQEKLTQAQAEAQRIRSNATENAQTVKAAILAQAQKEVESLKAKATDDLNADRERAIAQLRYRVATMALSRVESQLRTGVDEALQRQLVDRSIALLGAEQ